MVKYIKENWTGILTALFLIVVGILLLVNPSTFATAILKVAGAVLILFGGWEIFKYFRTDAAEAAKGSGFSSGMTLITGGAICIFSGNWIAQAFPVLAVAYGVMQVLFGYQKLQKMVDMLRAKSPAWWLMAISAGISILFGFLIALNPNMTIMSIWVFTGITMIFEGVFDFVAMYLTAKGEQNA